MKIKSVALFFFLTLMATGCLPAVSTTFESCLLYTSDAADERSSVDLGGRRIIKKKTQSETIHLHYMMQQQLVIQL